MTINELKQQLDNALDDYSHEISSCYSHYGEQAATQGDIVELSKQTFYLLDKFKDSILKYLENH